MGNPEVTIPITLLGVKELQVIGSFRYCVRPFLQRVCFGSDDVRYNSTATIS